ncbi:acyltransferase family protein [Caballeronia concitans]|uniref:Acyltransferase 3 n=1 Tax=Caballeronia concitans TaxID=1777133 RepID=A0A658QZK0_9BURK|nr:acyltransferase [Caballeronia concitans]SAL34861.1 acyltransferase 3 [Caballeronia concitans]
MTIGSTSAITTKTVKLDFIQALRGIAALGVVLCHARFRVMDTPWWDFAQRYVVWGAGGVDLFFIISGFIMVYTTRNSGGSARDVVRFALRRFAKVWPPYALVSIVSIFLVSSGWTYVRHESGHLFRSLLFLPIKAEEPMYLGAGMMPLPVGWTLNFEAYFYVVFGISMLFRRMRWVAFFGWMLLTLVALPAIQGQLTLIPLVQMGFRSAYLSMITNPIIWDFVAGVLIGLVFLSGLVITARAAWLLLVTGLTIALWGFAGNIGIVAGIAPGLRGWGGFSILIVLAYAMLVKVHTLHVPRSLVALGDVSFTLYLIHGPVFALIDRFFAHVHHPELLQTWANAFLSTGLSVVAAAAVGGLLERRLHDATLSRLLKLFSLQKTVRATDGIAR